MAQIILDHVDKAYPGGVKAISDLSLDIRDGALAGGKSLWTARVSKESRVRHGAPLELSVDTRYLQFFDPGSGLGAIPVPRPQQCADRGKL